MGVLSEARENFDFEIVDEFLDHFEIMKDAMQPAVLALNKAEEYPERINELFRIFHNLKSASAYLKFETMNRLAGFVEEALEKMRGKNGPAPDAFIDWMLEVGDQFERWYYDLTNDHPRFSPLDFEIFNTPFNGKNE